MRNGLWGCAQQDREAAGRTSGLVETSGSLRRQTLVTRRSRPISPFSPWSTSPIFQACLWAGISMLASLTRTWPTAEHCDSHRRSWNDRKEGNPVWRFPSYFSIFRASPGPKSQALPRSTSGSEQKPSQTLHDKDVQLPF